MKTATDLRGCGPFAESSPAEVRAALPPEDVPAFDEEWHRAMAEADGSFDLAAVNEMLDGWRRTAWSFTHDPVAHRRALDAARRLLAGEDVPTTPWDTVMARLGR